MLRDLMNRPFQAEMVEGHHRVSLNAWEYFGNEDPEKDFITLTLKHEHGESRNNMFERDMSIFMSHVRRQLGRAQETVNPQDFLKELIDNQTEFDCWVKFVTTTTRSGLRRVRNLLFIEPLTSDAPATDDSELPPGV